jgi:CDP-6-deoxy-D-xylo-4-hexulose-3-dehydrase
LGKRRRYLGLLDKLGVETRAIISGNFLNQPAIKLHKLGNKKDKFTQAQEIEDLGFFIGLPTRILNSKSLNKLVNILLKIDNI